MKKIVSLLIVLGLFANVALKLAPKNDLLRVFHIDCGRKYFTPQQLKDQIDQLALYGYNAIELAIGNDGHRFLLDDMALKIGKKEFTSEQVRNAINEGNKKYFDAGTNELTQAEMDDIISYAKSKGISIIPLINSPGHMDSVLTACSILLEKDCSYHKSITTIDISDGEVIEFAYEVHELFINYFKGKVTHYNMGGDEYANDVYRTGSMGFGHLVAEGKYNLFIQYINQMAKLVKDAGMIPMAFNDGFYFNGILTEGTIDKSIWAAYWSTGWGDYKLYPAKELANMGYKILNTHAGWYYILDREDYYRDHTLPGIQNNPYNSVIGSGELEVQGAMLCFWCDNPRPDYNEVERSRFIGQLDTFKKVNPSIFPQ